MLLSPNSITSSPLVLITAALFGIIFFFGLISRSYYEPVARIQPPNPDQYLPIPPQQVEEEARPVEIPRPVYVAPVHTPKPPPPPKIHPIEKLIHDAEGPAKRLSEGDAGMKDIKGAAALYREARGRHPPPGFERWYEYAKSHNAVAFESLFDQIYQDLEPFWSLDPQTMRQQAIDWPFVFTVRNGTVRTRAARLVAGEWLDYWGKMFEEIVQYLPDVDIPVNHIDESRLIVPWEDMAEHMKKALATRNRETPKSKDDVITTYETLPELSLFIDDIALTGLGEDGPWMSNETMWNLTRQACHPDSEARRASEPNDFAGSPPFLRGFPGQSAEGYVSNWTEVREVCHHASLRHMIGTFVNPRFTSVNTTLFPLFSGCKIAGINNEILLPAAKYFSDEEEFAFRGGDVPWSEKKDGIFWRGQATGGAHKEKNWKRFHRHRFVSMLNGSFVTSEEHTYKKIPPMQRPSGPTEVKGAFAGVELVKPGSPQAARLRSKHPAPHHIPLPKPPDNPYGLSALSTKPERTMGEYLATKTDVGFDHLMCDSWVWSVLGPGTECGYMDPYYRAVERVPMADMFGHKYLPDVDGNSYSGRYRAFLSSGSLPLKATIWSEWHDSRLVPWKHFVPLDNSFADLYGVLEYFWGYGKGGSEQDGGPKGEEQFAPGGFRAGESLDKGLSKAGHDEQARAIAEEGKAWADKVLRREDMLVYVYRLVLEYARVVSVERERMAFVDDLFDEVAVPVAEVA